MAPVFYACALSFSKYLVERAGMPGVVSVFPEIPRRRVPERIAELTGRTLPALRAEWLAKLGLPGSADR